MTGDQERRLGVLWFVMALIVGGLAIAAAFIHASAADLRFFFMSDTLYLPSIYRDVWTEGNSLAEWSLNPAPNFFPDMGLYFLLNAVFGKFTIASYVFPFVQFVLIALLFRAMARQLGVADQHIAWGVLLLGLIPMSEVWADDFGFAFHALVNSFHAGAFVNALLCSMLLLRCLTTRTPWPFLLLGACITLGAGSDKLFWVMFSVPATVTCALLATRKAVFRRMSLLVAVVVGCTWLAHFGLQRLDQQLPLVFERPYAYLAFERVAFSWGRFVEMMRVYLSGHVFVAAIMVLGLASTIWAAIRGVATIFIELRSRSAGVSARALPPTAATLLVGMFLPFVLLAPVLNGSFDGLDSLRYDFAVFMLAPLLAGTHLSQRAKHAGKWLFPLVLLSVGVSALSVCAVGRERYRQLAGYKPDSVSKLDALAAVSGLQNGVGNYWDAKVITMFSDAGLFVLPVFPDLSLYIHVNREQMFYRSTAGAPVPFNFIVLHPELQADSLSAILRQPPRTVENNGVDVLLTRPWTYDPATRRPKVEAP